MSDNKPAILNDFPSATALRRFGAMIYDVLLILALEMLLWVILGMLGLFVVGDGTATVEARVPEWFSLPLTILVPVIFYGWFWTKGGRTLGMQAWRMQVRTFDGELISWKQVWIRCLASLLGLANLSTLLDKQGLALHDKLSKTVVVVDNDRILS